MLHCGLVFDPIIVWQYYDGVKDDNDNDNAADETGQLLFMAGGKVAIPPFVF